MRLALAGCDTGALSRALAAQCLAGRQVLLVGDSIMRYAYYQLVLWLVTGDWAPVPAAPCDFHHYWPDFNAYYAECAARTRGAEICSCFRVGDMAQAETHYFFGGAARVTFVFTEGTRPFVAARQHLDWLNVTCGATGAPCAQAGCAPAACTFDPPAGPLLAVYAALPHFAAVAGAVAARLPVDVAVVNSGFHSQLWEEELSATVDALAGALRSAAARAGAPPPALLWKSTTAASNPNFVSFDHARERAAFEALLAPDGWRLFDAHALTAHPSLAAAATDLQFYDGIHLRPAVNRGVNEALLLDLCFVDGAPLRGGG